MAKKNDFFGKEVAIFKDTIIVGAPRDDSNDTLDNGAAIISGSKSQK